MAILDETPNPLPLAGVAADPAATATVRPPQQVAPPMTSYRRSLRAELLPIIVLPFVLTASAAGLWPLWQQPPLAAVTTLVVSALVTTGLVLLSEPEQRAPALGMIFAAALLEVSWGDEWSSRPPLPLNLILGHSWLLVLGWALYRYPGGPLRPVERRSFQLIAVWVMLWPWALILSSQPTWLHYPPGTGWPSLWPERAVFAVTLELVNLSAVIILGLYVGLWVHRLRTTPAARLRSTVPSAVAGILGAGGGALVPISDALNLPPAWLGPIDAASIVGVLAVPAALLVAVARRHPPAPGEGRPGRTAGRAERRRLGRGSHSCAAPGPGRPDRERGPVVRPGQWVLRPGG